MAYAVITREPESGDRYAAALTALGLEIVAMPVTRTEWIDNGLDRVVRERTYDAIVVASARAARALAAAWVAPPRTDGRIVVSTWFEQMYGEPREAGPPERDAQGRSKLPKVWAVGAATARVLAEVGIACVVPEGVDDGHGLALALIEGLGVAERKPPLRERRILVPRAADGRRELLEAMVDAGATVDAMTVYKTFHADPADEEIVAGQRALEEGGAPICVMFAPSQVKALAELVPLPSVAATFVAIGETTAKALREARARRVVVADQPTPEGIAKAVRSVYPPKP